MKIKFNDDKVFDCSLRLYDGKTCSVGEDRLPDIEREMNRIDDDLCECDSTSDNFINFYQNECKKANTDADFEGDVLDGLSQDKIDDGWEWIFAAVEEV